MTVRTLVLALLALLVALAGCSAQIPSAPSIGVGAESDSPWGEEELTVAVAYDASTDRDFEPLVAEALAYWEEHAEQYAGYLVEYRLASDAADPDVVVTVVDDIAACGTEEHAAGCAPYVTRGPVDRPVHVQVVAGLSDASTVQVLKHELGHTLGLDHGDEPRDVMVAQSSLTTLSRPDATERALPWDDPTLSVHLDVAAVDPSERDAVRRQVNAALGYYDRGAAGTVPANVTFEYVESPDSADVVIRFAAESPCHDGPSSCGTLSGPDPDGDGAIEIYENLTITLTDIESEAVAWHVARWLGAGFGFEEEADYPEPLREDATAREQRREWWR